MIPAVFINSRRQPYVDKILRHQKTFETRSRNTLKGILNSSLGQRILIVETGRGVPVIRGIAHIDYVLIIRDAETWNHYRGDTQVPVDDEYDWKPTTKIKYLYHLTDVRPVVPFLLPATCRRHGRVWAEYEEEAQL